MIRAHLRIEGETAHVVIYTDDDPTPCGVLTMPAEQGTELAARVNDHEVSPVVTPEIAAHVLHAYGQAGGTAPTDPSVPPLIAALTAAPRARRRRLTAAEPGYARAVTLAAEGLRGITVLQSRVMDTAPVAVSVGGA